MGETEPTWPSLVTSTRIELHLNWLVDQKCSMGASNQPRLFPWLQVVLHKLIAKLHCWKQHLPSSLNTEMSSCFLDTVSSPVFYGLWNRKLLCMWPKEKCKHQASIKLCDLLCCTRYSLHTRYALLSVQDMLRQCWHKFVGIISQYLIWVTALPMRWNPCLTLLGWPATRE